MYSIVLVMALNGAPGMEQERNVGGALRYGNVTPTRPLNKKGGCGGCGGCGYGGCGYGGCGWGGCYGGYAVGCYGGYGGMTYAPADGGRSTRSRYYGPDGVEYMPADDGTRYEGERRGTRGDVEDRGGRGRGSDAEDRGGRGRRGGSDGTPESTGPAPATIRVSLPADARLTIDGSPTRSTSGEREFITPPLERGHEFTYTLEARVLRDGRPATISKQVAVHAGERTDVTLNPEERSVASK